MDTPRAPQAPAQDGFVSPQHDSMEAPGQCDPVSIKTKSVVFMQRVTDRFGEYSQEWNSIYYALYEFKSGLLSKREAWGAMMEILREHDDLREDLLALLAHQDAKWVPEDFGLEPVPSNPTQQLLPPYVCSSQQLVEGYGSSFAMPDADMFRPAFLQSQHQPQMRMPSVDLGFTWSPFSMLHVPQNALAASSAVLRSSPLHDICDHAGLTSYQAIESSSNTRPSSRNGCSMPVILQTQCQNLQQPTDRNPFASTSVFLATLPFPADDALAQSQHSSSTIPAMSSPFARSSLAMGYNSPNLRVSEPPHPGVGSYFDVSEGGNTHHAWRNATTHGFDGHQHTDSQHQSHRSPSTDPYLTPNHMLSSSPCWVPSLTMPNSHILAGTMAPPPSKHVSVPDARPSSGLPQMDAQTSPKQQKKSAAGTPFIHGICGKAFGTRRAVKKHHWGTGKLDNISTTTGCWAKHNKPNRAWDEHPSCKLETPQARAMKTARAESNAPTVPGMIPGSLNTLPRFPIVEGSPDTVAGAATTAPFYHNHTIPHSSNLPTANDVGSLVTVVNAVAKVDAPAPQCRNDSVAAYLDAQITATEQDGCTRTLSEGSALQEN